MSLKTSETLSSSKKDRYSPRLETNATKDLTLFVSFSLSRLSLTHCSSISNTYFHDTKKHLIVGEPTRVVKC